jgi:epoxyqueuosine reductase
VPFINQVNGDLVSQIAQKASEVGFALFGITSPAPLENIGLFEKWISQNCAGDMSYLNSPASIKLRKDPKLLLPDCASIIVVGYPYGKLQYPANSDLINMAMFAQQNDYHHLTKDKLSLLLQTIVELTDEKTKGVIFCDTAPILEKDLARRAGLGWIGKNSLLISHEFGSLFNLGELFLNLHLPFTNQIVNDACGDCQRCIQSCPTHCIQSNRTLQADQCVSYLTIEHKGMIPIGLRNSLGSWIYGCDCCQLACPWNEMPYLRISSDSSNNQKNRIEEFLEMAKSTHFFPSNRKGNSKITRNIAIALGNLPNENGFDYLIELIRNKDPLIRASAAWALGQFHTLASKKTLLGRLDDEDDSIVIEEINRSISRFV